MARSFQRSGVQCRDRLELCNTSERLDYEIAQGHDVELLSVIRESWFAIDVCSEGWYEGLKRSHWLEQHLCSPEYQMLIVPGEERDQQLIFCIDDRRGRPKISKIRSY